MKDTYIRFRCTSDMKELIEAAAMHAGENVSEYILGVLMDDIKCLHEASFEAVLYKHGNEITRKNIGTYLLDEHERASKYTTYKELTKKASDALGNKGTAPGYSIRIESDGRKVSTNFNSDFMWLEER